MGRFYFHSLANAVGNWLRELAGMREYTGLHPHSFRHFLATTWVAKGLDVKKLQMFLGHASIATTMAYVDTNFEAIEV